MITIADKLKEFGFNDSSYQNNKNGSRISAYRERPLHEGLYSGWKTFPSAPIVREVSWNEILRKNQKIKISYVFKILKPLVLNNSYIKNYLADIFDKKSPQHNYPTILEFQNILFSLNHGGFRPTTSEDVYSFDFNSTYRILAIDENNGYMAICKDIYFNLFEKKLLDNNNIIFISTGLLTFVDLVELIENDDGLKIDYDRVEIFLNEWIKLVKSNVKISEANEDKKIKVINNNKSSKKKITPKKISLKKDSELIKEFNKGIRTKSLIISLMGVLTKKNIEVNGEGVKYIISWNNGKSKKNLNKSEAISYIEKKMVKL